MLIGVSSIIIPACGTLVLDYFPPNEQLFAMSLAALSNPLSVSLNY